MVTEEWIAATARVLALEYLVETPVAPANVATAVSELEAILTQVPTTLAQTVLEVEASEVTETLVSIVAIQVPHAQALEVLVQVLADQVPLDLEASADTDN